MIVASELRVGNWVNLKLHGHHQIKNGHNIQELIDDPSLADPILITEDWLLKFGWVWNEACKSYEKYPNGDARLNLSYNVVSNSYTMFNYVLRAIIAERIWYVHELQNLHFSLMREELKIIIRNLKVKTDLEH